MTDTEHRALESLRQACARLRLLAANIPDQMTQDITLVLGVLDERNKKIAALTERLRDSTGVIKLHCHGPHITSVIDRNNAALQ